MPSWIFTEKNLSNIQYIYIIYTGTTYTGYLAMCAAINRALGMFIVQIIVVNVNVMVRHLFVTIGAFSFIALGILYGKK